MLIDRGIVSARDQRIGCQCNAANRLAMQSARCDLKRDVNQMDVGASDAVARLGGCSDGATRDQLGVYSADRDGELAVVRVSDIRE